MNMKKTLAAATASLALTFGGCRSEAPIEEEPTRYTEGVYSMVHVHDGQVNPVVMEVRDRNGEGYCTMYVLGMGNLSEQIVDGFCGASPTRSRVLRSEKGIGFGPSEDEAQSKRTNDENFDSFFSISHRISEPNGETGHRYDLSKRQSVGQNTYSETVDGRTVTLRGTGFSRSCLAEFPGSAKGTTYRAYFPSCGTKAASVTLVRADGKMTPYMRHEIEEVDPTLLESIDGLVKRVVDAQEKSRLNKRSNELSGLRRPDAGSADGTVKARAEVVFPAHETE